MPTPEERTLRRIRREELRACERSPDLHREIRQRLEQRVPPSQIEPLLDQALRGSPTVATMVDAARCALSRLAPKLSEEELQRLQVLQDQVLRHQIGPSLLKAEIYRLARQHQDAELLESTWFDDLFERTETRRLTDLDAS